MDKMKKTYLYFVIIFISYVLSCGIPTPDSVTTFNTPVILTGTKSHVSGSYYSYSKIIKSFSPKYIQISIQAYQPEGDFNGFNIYIRNSVDHPTKTLQVAAQEHYQFDSSTGNYPYKTSTEGTYIVSEGSRTSGLYPSISLNYLASVGVYPALQSYPVEFTFKIEWDGQAQELTSGGLKTYFIGVTSVDSAGFNESKISNIIQVYYDNTAPGDPDF